LSSLLLFPIATTDVVRSGDYSEMSREELDDSIEQQFILTAMHVAEAGHRAKACGHFEAAAALYARYNVQAQRIDATHAARQLLETEKDAVIKPLDGGYRDCAPAEERKYRNWADDWLRELAAKLNEFYEPDM
jgi:hypothetical protein